MTDAARRDRALSAAPAGVTEPIRGALLGWVGRLRAGGLVESTALITPIVLIGLTQDAGPALWSVAFTYLLVTALLALIAPARHRARDGAWAWTALRIVLAVAMIGAGQVLTGRTGLLSVLYLPIVALAAFAGPRLLALAVVTSIGSHLLAESIDRATVQEAFQRLPGLAGAVLLVAVGTWREVAVMERARDRLRRAIMIDRRRARQIAGLEAIGRIVAGGGPTPDALDRVVDRIDTQFGYRCVSIYLGTQHHVELVAHRGYTELVESFSGERGIVGRVMQTRRPAFVRDVSQDPEYWALHDDVVSEICVPLMADGEFLGFINVESKTRLDIIDLRVMVAIADQLAAALVIGRDRAHLAERAELFRSLHAFGEAVNGTLQPDELFRSIVRAVPTVVRADVTALHVLDRASGRYLLAAIEGGGDISVGSEVRAGDGMAGRAIRDRVLVLDDDAPPPPVLRSVARGFLGEEPPPPMLGAAMPLVRDGAVLGALTLLRRDRTHRFTELERDALAMLASQIAMAVTNVQLHADVAESALRDPLTGLFNRRYFDPALEQLFARRSRVPYEERVPLAAVMFDLDHFSELNNLHGHQVGDEVLRAFGSVLRTRMRSTDLVARYGGEEFVAILYRATLDDAVRIADEIREQLAKVPIVGVAGEELGATVSAGCAAIGAEEETPEALLRAADVALYMAKRAGRDRVCAA